VLLLQAEHDRASAIVTERAQGVSHRLGQTAGSSLHFDIVQVGSSLAQQRYQSCEIWTSYGTTLTAKVFCARL
jgi:hypothetical protein